MNRHIDTTPRTMPVLSIGRTKRASIAALNAFIEGGVGGTFS